MSLLLVTACGGGSSSSDSASGGGSASGTFVIGAVVPETGTYSNIGRSDLTGLKLGVQEVNAAGGINGQKVQLKVLDDAGDPAKTLLAVQQFHSENVNLLLPDPLSFLAAASLPYLTQNKVFTISYSVDPSLSDPSKYPYNFLNGELTTKRVPAMLAAVKQFSHATKIGILNTDTTAQVTEAKGLQTSAAAAGIQAVKRIQVSSDATDVTPELASLKAAGADTVVSAVESNQGIQVVMSGMQSVGWKAPVYFFPEAISGNIEQVVPKAVASQFHALLQSVSIRQSTPDPTLSSYAKQAAATGPIGNFDSTASATDDIWLAQWVFQTSQKQYGGTSSTDLAKAAESIGSSSFNHSLVFKPNPGWTATSHGTANFNYSNFYGVINYGPLVDGQYAGTLFTTPTG